MTTLPADANGPPLLVVLEAAEDAAGELVRGWLEDGVPAAASSGAVPADAPPVAAEELAVRLALVAVGACRAAGDAVRVAIPPGEPALHAVLQSCVSVCQRLAEVTARDLADLPVARVVARTSLAAVDACREALTLLQRTPLAERATSAEAGGGVARRAARRPDGGRWFYVDRRWVGRVSPPTGRRETNPRRTPTPWTGPGSPPLPGPASRRDAYGDAHGGKAPATSGPTVGFGVGKASGDGHGTGAPGGTEVSAPVVVVCDADPDTGERLPDVPPGVGVVDAGRAVAFVRAQQPRTVVVALDTDALADQPLLARLRAVAPGAALVIVAPRDAAEQVPAVVAALGRRRSGSSARATSDPPPTLQRGSHAGRTGMRGATDARVFVRELLESWHCDGLVQDAELVASELVTNAVLHAGGPVEVALVLAPDSLRIEVRDMSRATPELLDASRHRRGGHGLRILTHVASSWGVQPTADGKVVWAELAR
ncbi:MAG: ATP-binding protein [Acidimicrobiales bacterium]|nr:ATP-binding protein [Acidimicrobiales bacterium]